MINMIMSALAIIIIAGGIIALFAWLFYKAIHADPAETDEIEMYIAETAKIKKEDTDETDETAEIKKLKRDLDFFMCQYFFKP